MTLKSDAPTRSVMHVGPGDYVKIGSEWRRISSNTAFGDERTPRSWTVTTEDGRNYTMFDINLYAKAEDLRR